MLSEDILKDYEVIITTIAIYNEIAERDINYWYDEAQKDEWLQTLINMANKYKLKYKLSNDNIENINILENILTHYLRKIILI